MAVGVKLLADGAIMKQFVAKSAVFEVSLVKCIAEYSRVEQIINKFVRN